MTTDNKTPPSESEVTWTGIAKKKPFTELEQRYRLTAFDNLLHADTLNTIKNRLNVDLGAHRGQAFECQDAMAATDDYYETIIHRDQVIPTRPDSWHDLFNGLVWLSFPKTKSLLNQWHVEDIEKHGLTPRTHRRNQITLFDECGVILAVSETKVCEHLSNHLWQQAFIEDRHDWGDSSIFFNEDRHQYSKQHNMPRYRCPQQKSQWLNPTKQQKIKPFIFGHANYEMLMNPFIGLTGKWLAVNVEDTFFKMSYENQLYALDSEIYKKLKTQKVISTSGKLMPLPLLGVPGWHYVNQTPSFYANESYFRPLRSK